jgi:hypothetical protein
MKSQDFFVRTNGQKKIKTKFCQKRVFFLDYNFMERMTKFCRYSYMKNNKSNFLVLTNYPKIKTKFCQKRDFFWFYFHETNDKVLSIFIHENKIQIFYTSFDQLQRSKPKSINDWLGINVWNCWNNEYMSNTIPLNTTKSWLKFYFENARLCLSYILHS